MFQSVDAGRKRIRPSGNGSASSTGSSSRRRRVLAEGSNAPFKGTVVCLTGLPADQKTKLHRLVEKHGGRFTRELDTSKVTHLVALVPEGAKYQTAASCSHIRIVSPSWIEQSAESGACSNERDYLVSSKRRSSPEPPSVAESIDKLLGTKERNNLFSSCRFLMIGFEDESSEVVKLSQLVRRGKGTIYWELNEVITHLVVNDETEDALRDAAQGVCMYHPNGPVVVSKQWVTTSWQKEKLLPPQQFKPRKRIEQVPKVLEVKKKDSTRESSTLFRRNIFCLIRLLPPADCVDFDTNKLEKLIITHGGQLLSSRLLEALRSDKALPGFEKRTCYMVCWGGFTPLHATINPLLSQLNKEDLCTVVPVTPIWLQTAATDQKLPSPTRRPLLYQPQSWTTHKLPDTVKIAFTGFVGSERTSLIHLITAMGATYTSNLKSSNTHLVCKQDKGPKYEKALEWKLHVVRLDWLYHVAQFGYAGEDGSDAKVGCEARFSFVQDMTISNEARASPASESAGPVPAGDNGAASNESEIVESQEITSQTTS